MTNSLPRVILVRLGLLVVALGVLIALAVPFSALDGNAERSSCGTLLIRSDGASNPFIDPILRDDCAFARGPYQLTVLVVAGVGAALLLTGLVLPRPAGTTNGAPLTREG